VKNYSYSNRLPRTALPHSLPPFHLCKWQWMVGAKFAHNVNRRMKSVVKWQRDNNSPFIWENVNLVINLQNSKRVPDNYVKMKVEKTRLNKNMQLTFVSSFTNLWKWMSKRRLIFSFFLKQNYNVGSSLSSTIRTHDVTFSIIRLARKYFISIIYDSLCLWL
jgi:hypothetical protein